MIHNGSHSSQARIHDEGNRSQIRMNSFGKDPYKYQQKTGYDATEARLGFIMAETETEHRFIKRPTEAWLRILFTATKSRVESIMATKEAIMGSILVPTGARQKQKP